MFEWLNSSGFGWTDFLSFLLGIAAVFVWKWMKLQMWKRRNPGKCPTPHRPRWMLGVASIVAMCLFWSMYSTNETQRELRRVALETHSIVVRVCEDSKVSSIERGGLQTLLLTVMAPPPDIKNLPSNNPVRQEFGRQKALEYLGVLEEAGKQRRSIRAGGHVPDEVWNKYMGPQPPPRCE